MRSMAPRNTSRPASLLCRASRDEAWASRLRREVACSVSIITSALATMRAAASSCDSRRSPNCFTE